MLFHLTSPEGAFFSTQLLFPRRTLTSKVISKPIRGSLKGDNVRALSSSERVLFTRTSGVAIQQWVGYLDDLVSCLSGSEKPNRSHRCLLGSLFFCQQSMAVLPQKFAKESSQAKLSEAESQIQQHAAREIELGQQLAMLDSSLAAALSDNELQATAKVKLEQSIVARTKRLRLSRNHVLSYPHCVLVEYEYICIYIYIHILYH